MAGGRTIKGPANEAPGRTGSRSTPRGGIRRSAPGGPTGVGRRGRRKGGAKIIPFPRGRRSGRSLSPARRPSPRRAVGRGRLRWVVGAVAVVCLSLGARAAQLSFVDDGRYQAFATEERPGTAAEDRSERGSIISADGRGLATSHKA